MVVIACVVPAESVHIAVEGSLAGASICDEGLTGCSVRERFCRQAAHAHVAIRVVRAGGSCHFPEADAVRAVEAETLIIRGAFAAWEQLLLEVVYVVTVALDLLLPGRRALVFVGAKDRLLFNVHPRVVSEEVADLA